MGLFVLFCVTGFCMNNVSANYHDPQNNKIVINGARCYCTEFEIIFYDVNNDELSNYKIINYGANGITCGEYTYDFSNAVRDGAKSMKVSCRPWDSGIYGWVTTKTAVTPTYWNILGSLGGLKGWFNDYRPRADISWIGEDNNIRKECRLFPT
jgi:hypothetical protein